MSTQISNQDTNFLHHAFQQAQQSPVLMRHGAVATANGKIIGRGFNNYRTYSSDNFIKNTCTCHAEIAALRNVYNSLTNTYGKYGEHIKGV
jgi:tRNA(Arg) A34 adenosine deaminase TadA